MADTIVQMTPMPVLGGLIAGWLAETTSRARGHGFISDMILGRADSVIAGTLVWLIMWRNAGMTMLLIGCVGAALAIFAQRGVWPSTRVAS